MSGQDNEKGVPERAYALTHPVYEIAEDGNEPEIRIKGVASVKDGEYFIHAGGSVFYFADKNAKEMFQQVRQKKEGDSQSPINQPARGLKP